MNQSENADWQQRVLSESELNQLLLTKSSLDAITVLQRQVELREQASSASMPLPEPSIESQPVPTPNQPFVPAPSPAEPASMDPKPSADSADIATDLNAIFAARAADAGLVNSQPKAALEEPVSQQLPQEPIADTGSFVPTFANPVPPVRPVGPSASPVKPEISVGEIVMPEDIQPAAPFFAPQVISGAKEAPVPVDDFKASIWSDEDSVDSSSAEEQITVEDEPVEEIIDQVARPAEDLVESESKAAAEFTIGLPEDIHLGEIGSEAEPREDDLPNSKQVFELTEEEALAADASVLPEPSGRRSAISLFTTWNGNGTLLLLTATGFLAAQQGLGLSTLLAGVFAALFLSGFGFAAAALAARRGRLPQSVLSRATFGVIGSNIPLALVVIARIAATSLVSIFAVNAMIWFFPSLPSTFPVQAGGTSFSVLLLYPLILALVLVAGIVAFVAKRIYYSVARIIALVLIAWSVGAVALSIWLKPGIYSLAGAVSYSDAMWVATALIVVLGLLWGTSASDETPDLKSTTVVPKLVATSLLNSTIIGSLAVVAGYAVFQMNLPAIHGATTGAIYCVVLVFGLSNLIRRNTDAFRGFGLRRTPGWLFVVNIVVVAASAIALAYRLGVSGAWTNSVGYLYFVGVPVLAWVTTFGMDSVLRKTDYHEVSLMRGYGFYGRFNWANLIGWIMATGIGWGFVQSNLVEFGWLGYFTRILGLSGAWQIQSLGVWIAMGIGLLVPLIFTIPRIRDQEAEVTAIEARRTELADVLGIAD